MRRRRTVAACDGNGKFSHHVVLTARYNPANHLGHCIVIWGDGYPVVGSTSKKFILGLRRS